MLLANVPLSRPGGEEEESFLLMSFLWLMMTIRGILCKIYLICIHESRDEKSERCSDEKL